MALKLRRGLETNRTNITPEEGELIYTTDQKILYVGDGSTIGGMQIGGQGSVTSVDISGGTTGLTATGGPITTTGTLTLSGTLAIANGGTGSTTASDAINALLPTQTENSGKYLTTNGTAASWANLNLTNQIHVAKNGNDTTGDGSLTNPFLTIGAALTYMDTAYPVTSSSGTHVAVFLSPGTYNESLTITRPRTHFIGAEGKSKTVRINGTVTFNPGVFANNSIYDTAVTFTKIFFSNANTSANSVVVTGTILNSVEFNECYIYSAGTGIPLLINNTGSGGNRLRIINTEVTAVGDAPGIDMTNITNAYINGLSVSSASTTDAIKFTASSLTIGNLVVSSASATNLVTVAGGVVTMGNSGLSSSTSNGNGFNITAGTQLVVTNTIFNIPLGTGNIVTGQAGSFYVYGGNQALYGTNNSISANVTKLPTSGSVNAADVVGTISIASGGTGATTATAALTALLPVQTENSGKYLTTDGTTASWGAIQNVGTLNSLTVSGAVEFGAKYTETRSNVSGVSNTTIDCSLSNIFNVTLTENITILTLSNIPESGRVYNMTLFINQDETGSRTITWPGTIKWSGGSSPTLTTTGNKTDILTLVTHDGGTNWYGFVAGQNF